MISKTWIARLLEAAEHFFSVIGKHQPGCAIEEPLPSDRGSPKAADAEKSSLRGSAQT